MTITMERSKDHAADASFIRRFEPVERFGHWWVAGWFVLTALSGIMLGDEPDRTSPVLIMHVISASALVAGALLVPLLPGRRAVWATLHELYRMDETDRRALRAPATLLPFERRGAAAVRWAKFNTGQKLAAYALAVLFAAIYATGIASLLFGAGGLHGAAVVTALVVLGGHVFLAVINPSTRPALRGMLTGRVRLSWATRHHPRWVAEMARGGPRRSGKTPPISTDGNDVAGRPPTPRHPAS